MGWRTSNRHGCPCGGCPNRLSGERDASCHGSCERYKEWRKKLDAINETARKTNNKADIISEDLKRFLWRKQRYMNQGHFHKAQKD